MLINFVGRDNNETCKRGSRNQWSCVLVKSIGCAVLGWEMAQQVKMFVNRLDSLSSIPGTQVLEKRTNSWMLPSGLMALACPCLPNK